MLKALVILVLVIPHVSFAVTLSCEKDEGKSGNERMPSFHELAVDTAQEINTFSLSSELYSDVKYTVRHVAYEKMPSGEMIENLVVTISHPGLRIEASGELDAALKFNDDVGEHTVRIECSVSK